MSRKILFFLSSDSFHARIWKNGSLEASRQFSSNADSLAQFRTFLATIQDPVYLLVDLIEEDFRQEVVPHLTGANYQALLQRKYDQYYRSTPFRMARLQQRLTEGRRDDELLFSALTNASRISTWLDLLLQQQIPVAGIYSVPHISLPLINHIDSDHLLLLSWEKDAGLRQTYFLRKRLRFSRLTPVSPNSSFAEVIATESARTHQYLQSLSLTPQGQTLNVHIICHAEDRAQLDASLNGNRHMQYAYLDIQQLARHFKLRNTFSNSDATPLFLHLLATQAPRASYASNEHTHFHQLWLARRGLYGLAAATALTCLVWSALSLYEGNSMNDEVDTLQQQASTMQQEAQRIVQQFPGNTHTNAGSISASDMKTAVTLLRSLQSYSTPLQQMLHGLTSTLNDFPRIATGKISWQATTDSGLAAQEITYTGELMNFGQDYRGALNYLERFQLVLGKAGYTVSLSKSPLDFSSKGSISTETNQQAGDKDTEFSLKMIWRPQP